MTSDFDPYGDLLQGNPELITEEDIVMAESKISNYPPSEKKQNNDDSINLKNLILQKDFESANQMIEQTFKSALETESNRDRQVNNNITSPPPSPQQKKSNHDTAETNNILDIVSNFLQDQTDQVDSKTNNGDSHDKEMKSSSDTEGGEAMDEQKDESEGDAEKTAEKEKILFDDGVGSGGEGENGMDEEEQDHLPIVIPKGGKLSKRMFIEDDKVGVDIEEGEEAPSSDEAEGPEDDNYVIDGFVVGDDDEEIFEKESKLGVDSHRALNNKAIFDEIDEFHEEEEEKDTPKKKDLGKNVKKEDLSKYGVGETTKLNWRKNLKTKKFMDTLDFIAQTSNTIIPEKLKIIYENKSELWDWVIQGCAAKMTELGESGRISEEDMSYAELLRDDIRNCLELIVLSSLKCFSDGDLTTIKNTVDSMPELKWEPIKQSLTRAQESSEAFYTTISAIIDDFIKSIADKLNANDEIKSKFFRWFIILKKAKSCTGFLLQKIDIDDERADKYYCHVTNRLLKKGDKVNIVLMYTSKTKENDSDCYVFYVYCPPGEKKDEHLHAILPFLNLGSFRNAIYSEAQLYKQKVSATESPNAVVFSFFEDGKAIFNILIRFIVLTASIAKLKATALKSLEEGES
jgi:hypothetical protein